MKLNFVKSGKESISSVIWVQPRIVTECPELKIVCDEFTKKYGKGLVVFHLSRAGHLPLHSTLFDPHKNTCNSADLVYRLLETRFQRS